MEEEVAFRALEVSEGSLTSIYRRQQQLERAVVGTGRGPGGETQAGREQGTPGGVSNISLLLKITLHKVSFV